MQHFSPDCLAVSVLLAAALMSAGGALSIDLKNYAKPFSGFYGDMIVLPSSSTPLVASVQLT